MKIIRIIQIQIQIVDLFNSNAKTSNIDTAVIKNTEYYVQTYK